MTVEFRPSDWTQPAPARPCAPPAPIAASAAACWRRPTARAARPSRAIPTHPANAGRLCSKGSALGETLGLETRLLHPIVDGARVELGRTRSIRLRGACRRVSARARAGGDRLLSVGPAADRGLLRRQQAGEGLHRHAARRHQLAAVHGLVGGRPSPRLRRRRRAAVLRRSGAGRPRRAGRAPMPPGAIRSSTSASRRRAPSAACASSTSIRAARPPARAPTCICRSGPAPTACCGAACWSGSPSAGVIDCGLHRATTREGFACGAAARAAQLAPQSRCGRARDRPRAADDRSASTAGSPARRASSPATARASTSRRRAPTRSTPSSTATWRPGASASRAPARCRSPASPTPWAGARSAGSPTCWPRTWASREAERDRVRRFWNAPNLVAGEGLKAVDMFDAIADGRIKALWVMGTNPAVSLPRADAVRDGAGASSSCWSCPRTSPPTTRSTSRTCACRRRPGARRTARSPTRSGASRASARSCRLPGERAARLVDAERRWRGGWATARRSPIGSAADIFDEHARLSGFENDGSARLRHLRAVPA